VTATKVLPVASLVAVTVTPGNTAPVESVSVPFSTASCANPPAGSARMTQTRKHLATVMDVLLASVMNVG